MKLPVKHLVTAGVVGAIGIGGLATTGIANAQTNGGANGDPTTSLVDKIASTFNLDKSKVQKVFDENRTEREAKHEQMMSERLQKLVDDGKITAAQKTAIETKLKEMKADRDANKDKMKDMTQDERKAAMDKKRQDLEAWAKEQGLDLTVLRGILGGPGGHGGMHGMRGEM